MSDNKLDYIHSTGFCHTSTTYIHFKCDCPSETSKSTSTRATLIITSEVVCNKLFPSLHLKPSKLALRNIKSVYSQQTIDLLGEYDLIFTAVFLGSRPVV
jgi:hypothetical protein